MKKEKPKYRCTFPKMAQVFMNGKPWSEHSEGLYGNNKGICPADKYYQQLKIEGGYYFNNLHELLWPWRYWKEQNEEYQALGAKNGIECDITDFFYEASVTKKNIIVTWGWTDHTKKFLDIYNVPELKVQIVIKITDVKVDLDDFSEIK